MNDPTKSFRLDGKTILVTGASSGIGAMFAREFAAAGGRVALAARRVERLQSLADELRAAGASVTTVALDVTQTEKIASALDQIEADLGVVDILINNAGVAQPASFLKTSADTLDSTMATNFTAAWHLTAEVAKRLVAAKRGGSIINVASVLGLGVGPGVRGLLRVKSSTDFFDSQSRTRVRALRDSGECARSRLVRHRDERGLFRHRRGP